MTYILLLLIVLLFNQGMEVKTTVGDLTYIETQPSEQKFELCLVFIVVVSVLMLFDERIARNEFCVAEL